MFPGGQGHLSALGPGQINDANVFMGRAHPVNVEKPGPDQRPGPRSGGRLPLPDQLDLQPALFPGLTVRRLLRILVQLDVPADGQPLAQFFVVDHQNLPVLDDEKADGEIDLLVDVGHPAVPRRGRRRPAVLPLGHTARKAGSSKRTHPNRENIGRPNRKYFSAPPDTKNLSLKTHGTPSGTNIIISMYCRPNRLSRIPPLPSACTNPRQ